ncbi:MAG: hypothetical protein CBB72_014030 [Muricauda sp. TMED12]|nr:MAG: hypothetical protein CBB72_014030 [Muricauda sp. TMED12]
MNTLQNPKTRNGNHGLSNSRKIFANIALFALLFGSCVTDDGNLPPTHPSDDQELVTDLALPDLKINRIEHDGNWIYFIATDALYRLDISQDGRIPEFILEDGDGPMDLAVIDGMLYYTPFWVMTELRAIDLETKKIVPSGIDLPFYKAALAKDGDRLIYLETESSFGFETTVHARDMVTGAPDTLLAELPFEELEHMIYFQENLYFFRTYYTGKDKGSWLMRYDLMNGQATPEMLVGLSDAEDVVSPGTGLAVDASGIYFTHLLGDGLYRIDHGSPAGLPEPILYTEDISSGGTDLIGPLLIMGNHLYIGSNGHLFTVDLERMPVTSQEINR